VSKTAVRLPTPVFLPPKTSSAGPAE